MHHFLMFPALNPHGFGDLIIVTREEGGAATAFPDAVPPGLGIASVPALVG